MDPNIICFQHCNTKIFCFQIPDNCPTCKTDLANGNFNILPFRYPCPFVKASQYSCAVVIKPTKGDFLNNYVNSNDLHIGVTTSQGQVIEFDNDGLSTSNSSEWNQCILLFEAEEPWKEFWDQQLNEIITEDYWNSKCYDEDNYNCFTFVLTFLKKLKYGELSRFAENKVKFCENIILPRTVAAGKYTSIYRQLIKLNTYVICKVN